MRQRPERKIRELPERTRRVDRDGMIQLVHDVRLSGAAGYHNVVGASPHADRPADVPAHGVEHRHLIGVPIGHPDGVLAVVAWRLGTPAHQRRSAEANKQAATAAKVLVIIEILPVYGKRGNAGAFVSLELWGINGAAGA